MAPPSACETSAVAANCGQRAIAVQPDNSGSPPGPADPRRKGQTGIGANKYVQLLAVAVGLLGCTDKLNQVTGEEFQN